MKNDENFTLCNICGNIYRNSRFWIPDSRNPIVWITLRFNPVCTGASGNCWIQTQTLPGTAGFIKRDEVGTLAIILIGNIIGCFLMGLITRVSPMSDAIQVAATNILNTRISTGVFGCGILAIGCGILMTTAVTFARQKNFIPLLLSVPLFIVCGFPHCVADAFYYMTIPNSWTVELIGIYLSTVLGNAIGCNLYRIILTKEQYEIN